MRRGVAWRRTGWAKDSLGPVQAVTFDFWNTVMWEEPGSLKLRRLELWAQWLSEAGADLDPAELERAHDRAHFAYEAAWREGRQYRVEDAAAQIVADLEGRLPANARELLLEGYDEAGRRAAVHASDGVHTCLRALREAGVKLGIVCDIGLTPSPVVRELLAREALLDLFDDTTFSDEAGHYKPSADVFRYALARLGDPPPERCAHVGDRLRTDVAGARAMGMTSVRYTRVYDDPTPGVEEADVVTDDLASLPSALGVAVAR